MFKQLNLIKLKFSKHGIDEQIGIKTFFFIYICFMNELAFLQ